MVRLTGFILLLLISSFIHADSSLRIITNNTKLEIGKPLYITITANNINKNLTSINIESLEEIFGLYVIESSSKSNQNNKTQELKIALYPHNTGKMEIPPVTLGKYSSTPVTVTVLPARENKQTLSFDTSISSTSIWQRQQILVKTSVLTHSKFAKIKLDDFTSKGFESYKLESSREDLGNGMYRLTAGWAIYPLIAGIQNIHFPAINYHLKGKVQRKFIPKNIRFSVRALPSYIPPLMPIGKIAINSHISSGSTDINKSHTLSVEISTHTVLPSTLPNLPQNYILNKEILTGEVVSNVVTTHKNNILRKSIHHKLPISFNTSGLYHLPELTFKYFDTDSGKIVSSISKPLRTLVLATWLKLILIIILFVIVTRFIFISAKRIRESLQLRQKRIHVIKSTLIAKSPHELHQLLNEYAQTYNWRGNMTLRSWLASWEKSENSSANSVLDKLSNACYSGKKYKNMQSTLNEDIFILLSRKNYNRESNE